MPKVFDKAPKLYDMRTTEDIFWSPSWNHPGETYGGGCNSYVLLKPPADHAAQHYLQLEGQAVILMSINGLGEHRWDVPVYQVQHAVARIAANPTVLDQPWLGDFVEFYKAFKHFGLSLPEETR